ncbi:response regulator transcription factor [Flavobacterium azooxidireducens]|uniref:Response regulator transcription factor n=1 Tax=Flavobacterium azooxidireducens TaxID=1871076 RepID=A0ABY4KK41_9FLAO|nr:response regulator transcription factor [Flavobacterium azooxidireducens]UPQ80666.1 response regulator transcription factor [Flavobacterium azooxidireducens]
MNIKILMIDDHPLILEGYKTTLAQNKLGITLTARTITSLEEGYNLSQNKTELAEYSICFIDRNMPPFLQKDVENGEDLAVLLKATNPDLKIVILTSHDEPILLYELKNRLQPEGILVKSDLDYRSMQDAFQKIVEGHHYYSPVANQGFETIKKYLKDFDQTDRRIILLLSQGLRTKTLPESLDLSLSAINTRKKLIKDKLRVPHGDDEAIVKAARRMGLL